MLPARHPSNMKRILESYATSSYSTLQNSKSITQFKFRPKNNLKSNPFNGVNMSLCQMSNLKKNSIQKKYLRNSKSCTKGNIYSGNKLDLSSSTRFCNCDKKESHSIFATTKKLKTKKESLYRISDEFRKTKKSASNITQIHPLKNSETSIRKSNISFEKHGKIDTLDSSNWNDNKSEHEIHLDINSPLTIVENRSLKQIDYASTLTSNFKKALKIIDMDTQQNNMEVTFNRKFNIIIETINEISNADKMFKDTLNQIQLKLQELLKQQGGYYKNINNQLKTELNKVRLEFKIQCEKSKNEQKKLIEEIKEKSNILEIQTKGINKYKKQMGETEVKIRELSLDLNDLYKENKELGVLSNGLYAKLVNAKDNIETLIGELMNKNCNVNAKVIEIGKNKIKIPSLNFSIVNYHHQYGLDEDLEELNPANILHNYNPNEGIKLNDQ